jgi:hypothetical protein
MASELVNEPVTLIPQDVLKSFLNDLGSSELVVHPLVQGVA